MKHLPWFLCSVLAGMVAALLLEDGFSGRRYHSKVRKDSVVTFVYDSTIRHIHSEKIELVPADTVWVQVPVEVDTQGIINDYFSKYYYCQILRDSLLEAIIEDTISGNRLTNRKFSYKLLSPTSVVSRYERTENRYYFGVHAGIGPGGLAGLGPGLWHTRDKVAYSVNYDFRNGILSSGVYLKIRDK